jgi:hypothetical protein
MLGQAVRTPSGILVITFYSNIGLGRNQRRWKAKKKFCKLSVWTAINSVQTTSVRMERFSRPDGLWKIPKLLSGQEKLSPSGQPWLLSDFDSVFDSILTLFFTRFWVSKAYK